MLEVCSPPGGRLLYFSLAGLLKGHPVECQVEIKQNVKVSYRGQP